MSNEEILQFYLLLTKNLEFNIIRLLTYCVDEL